MGYMVFDIFENPIRKIIGRVPCGLDFFFLTFWLEIWREVFYAVLRDLMLTEAHGKSLTYSYRRPFAPVWV